MLEIIKSKLWELLKAKDVSLLMLYDSEGNILWHKGRDIDGKNITKGSGFSRSYIYESFKTKSEIIKENVITNDKDNSISLSVRRLLLKSLMIIPIGNEFFLYIDSGVKESFSEHERNEIKILGELLSDLIREISSKKSKSDNISGISCSIKEIGERVLKYSLDENPILLLGETGVGKSRLAELIHSYSGRLGKFVTAHMPSFQENLFESEIFGHKKGSFTGAISDKKGLVEEAEKGTLFLDEISEIPISFQTKLLRFIETKKFLKIGETKEREIDVRIISASNKNLHTEIKSGTFREDLFFRLGVLEINIPPLRERKEDIKLLVDEFSFLLKGKLLGKNFWKVMENHLWKGNIRELRTVLTRAGILSDDPITGSEIKKIMQNYSPEKEKTGLDISEEIFNEIKKGKTFWEVVKTPFLNRDLNRSEVREVIRLGLEQSGGKYVNLIKTFNLSDSEYKSFMKFLNKNRLQ